MRSSCMVAWTDDIMSSVIYLYIHFLLTDAFIDAKRQMLMGCRPKILGSAHLLYTFHFLKLTGDSPWQQMQFLLFLIFCATSVSWLFFLFWYMFYDVSACIWLNQNLFSGCFTCHCIYVESIKCCWSLVTCWITCIKINYFLDIELRVVFSLI